MKTATVRDLRNQFARISAWLEEGESVEITRSGRPFALLNPAAPSVPKVKKMPDFLARLKSDPPPKPSTESILDYDRADQ